MSEKNKAIVRRVLEEGYNEGNLAVIGELMADDYVGHRPEGDANGSEFIKDRMMEDRTACPDLHFTIEDQIAEGDKVSTLWTLSATNTGPSKFGPATGKKFTVSGISNSRISGDKIVEGWVMFDWLTVLKQLGMAPPMEHLEVAVGREG